MVNRNPYNAYANNSVLTASPQELTLMLYNGAIKFCNQGIKAIEEKDIQTAHKSIVRAQDIIEELMGSLDNKYEISSEYQRLYDYILHCLVEGNLYKKTEHIIIARDFIKELRDTWKEVMKLSKK